MQLEINERRMGGVTILDLEGKIVIGDGSRVLNGEVARLIQAGQREIILNLASVSYVDSSGIGELVSRNTTTRNAGGRFVLINLPKKIRDLLMITRLIPIFEIYDDEATALESFK